MKTKPIIFLLAAVCLMTASRLRAQESQESTIADSGLGFEFATRLFTPNDSRFDGGSNVFRLNFGGSEDLALFFERETMSFTFKNSGTGAPTVSGNMQSEGIGVAVPFSLTWRAELLVGRATTTIDGAAAGGTTLNSSDPMMNLGVFWLYRVSKAYIDFGLIYRTLTLSGTLPGSTLDGTGTTKREAVDDLGGILLNIGLGYAF